MIEFYTDFMPLLLVLGSIVSGSLAAVMGSKSEREAAKRNERSARQTNQANFLLSLASRGAGLPGSVPGLTIPEGIAGREAAQLPYYFDDRERALAEAAGETFDATGQLLGTPLEQGRRAEATLSRYLPIMDQATGTIAGIYDNSITDEELSYAKPVAESRIKLAGARKDAGLEALQETLNSIKAIQARKGFTGDSLGENRLRFDARRKVFSDAATDMSQAELANAMEARAIRQGGINRKLSSVNMPAAFAQQRLNLEEQPAAQVSEAFNRRLQPFQFFKMGPNGFQVNPLPQVNPNAGFGQIAATAAASAGRQVGNYFMNRPRPTTTTATAYQPSGTDYGVSSISSGGYGGGTDYGEYMGYGSGAGAYDAIDWEAFAQGG